MRTIEMIKSTYLGNIKTLYYRWIWIELIVLLTLINSHFYMIASKLFKFPKEAQYCFFVKFSLGEANKDSNDKEIQNSILQFSMQNVIHYYENSKHEFTYFNVS